MNGRLTWLLILLSLSLATVVVLGCTSPQPLPVAPTAIPTLIPATLPPEPTATLRPAALGVTFPSRRPSVQAAAVLYQQHCANCHGPDGKGLVPNARDFSDADYMRGQSPLRFYQIITDGRNEMPGWQDQLSVDERWDLAFYAWSFATSSEMLEQGKTIYAQNCITCHGPDGKGVVPGAPDFTDIERVASRTPSELFTVVTEGRGVMPSWQGRLTPDERWAAIEYLRTFAYEPATVASAATPSETPTTESAQEPTATPAEAAVVIPVTYVQKGCVGCHGDKAQGLVGPILAGLPTEHIKNTVRSGVPEAGMPPFDSSALSDEDLEALAQALHALSLQDAGVQLPEPVVDHLSQAWDALQAGDKAAVETHLKKAQEAAASAPPGVQATMKVVVKALTAEDWATQIETRLAVLLQK